MVLVRGAWDGIWVLGGANWSKADPKLVAEHRSSVGWWEKGLVDAPGPRSLLMLRTANCVEMRALKWPRVEMQLPLGRNYTETGREEQGQAGAGRRGRGCPWLGSGAAMWIALNCSSSPP